MNCLTSSWLKQTCKHSYAGAKANLLAHVRRWKSDSAFFKQLKKGFEVQDITAEIQSGANLLSSHTRGVPRLFQLTAKPH